MAATSKKGRDIIKFTKTEYQLRLHFFVYADFESVLHKQHSCEPSSPKSFTTQYQHQVPCGSWINVKCSDERYFEPSQVNIGDDAAKRFLDQVLATATICRQHLVNKIPLKRLTQDQLREYNTATNLRLTYQNRNLSFDELLKLDKSVSIHYRSLQYLVTEIYKVKMGLSSQIMNDILTLDQNDSYNLRSGVTVTIRNIRTNKFGFETISTIGAVLWQNFPNDIKNSDSLNIFKHRIKQWTPNNHPCKICRNVINSLGYI